VLIAWQNLREWYGDRDESRVEAVRNVALDVAA